MEQTDLLRYAIETLEQISLPYALVGAFASGAWRASLHPRYRHRVGASHPGNRSILPVLPQSGFLRQRGGSSRSRAPVQPIQCHSPGIGKQGCGANPTTNPPAAPWAKAESSPAWTWTRRVRAEGLLPDFAGPWGYAHRRTADTDIYFVSGVGQAECTFRVSGREPEFWDPKTGQIRDAVHYRPTADGRTIVPLDLPANGSVFVVFRKPAAPASRLGRGVGGPHGDRRTHRRRRPSAHLEAGTLCPEDRPG